MNIGKIALVCGGVIFIFGMIFYLQGNSVVGPTSSFMYSNPTWISDGIMIAIAGAIITCAGAVINLRRPR